MFRYCARILLPRRLSLAYRKGYMTCAFLFSIMLPLSEYSLRVSRPHPNYGLSNPQLKHNLSVVSIPTTLPLPAPLFMFGYVC